MNNKVNRSTLNGLELLILGSLISPALAGTEAETGGQGAQMQPPAHHAEAGKQAPPVRGPHGLGSASGPGAYGPGPGQGRGGYEMGDPGTMGGPYGGPDMMDDPRMMGGPYRGPEMMDEPGMMRGPYGGPGMMDERGMMRGPYGGPEMMDERGMMRGLQGGPGRMASPRVYPAETGEGPAGTETPATTVAPEGGPAGMGSPRGGPSTMSAPGKLEGAATAMLDGISSLDLTEEQRAELDAIREDHKEREKALIEKISVAAERLQELQQQQMEVDHTLNDLKGHLATANMDAANRAEELLTAEQRRRFIRGGAHVMMPMQQAQ